MKRLMPLRRVVIEITNEADPNDPEGNRKAVKSWHNRLNTGGIPRRLVTKLGRQLYLNLDAWEEWLSEKNEAPHSPSPGRPRAK